MENDILDSLVADLLSITPLVRRNIQKKLVRTAFSRVEHHISLPHLEIMLRLRKYGPQHIAGIGEALLIPKPQMTHLVDRLQELKLAVRKTNRADRRVVNVALTAKGRRVIDELDQAIRDSIKIKLSGLTSLEVSELSVCLRRLGEILSRL
jgi:DNA-binding MarR family transcriptional regulator